MVPFAWIRLCYRASHVDKYTEEDMYAFLRWIDLRANRGGNVHIDVHGRENIPEKDGLLANLLILEAMAYYNSTLSGLQEKLYSIVGEHFYNDRIDLKLDSHDMVKTVLEKTGFNLDCEIFFVGDE